MGRRSPNPRRIKIHLNYTVDEVARVLKVSKGTVRNWLKHGLVALNDRKPILILGPVLRQFLEDRRAKAKRPCPPGFIYCLRCRAPKPPALQMAEYLPRNGKTGNLRGICPDCGSLIHRGVALAKIDAIRGNLEIPLSEAHRRIGESASLTVNCDLEGVSQTC
jgi:hypothetical protein